MGYQSIVYMASISGIDKSIYEAAAIDGATKMQQIFRITLPMLKPTVITLTLMSIGRIFYSDFGLFYQVPQNSGALFNVTQTIDTYVYRGLMELNDVGMSAAAGLYQSLVGFALVLIANGIVTESKSFNRVATIILTILVIIAMLPILLIVIASFSAESSLIRNGYTYWPEQWSLDAYYYMVKQSIMILRSYGVSFLVTFVGTALSVIITTMLAYPMSRKSFKYRNALAFFVFFTMLFNGGIVPSYIMWTKFFHIKNTIWALIIPNYLVSAFNVILVKNYYQNSVPDSLIEAAQLDGASELKIFFKVMLPLAVPTVATISLFTGICYWNDWTNGLYYISNEKLYSIQQLLMKIMNNIQAMRSSSNAALIGTGAIDLPGTSIRMAMAVIGILPIMLIYPFVQKYLVKGVVVGAVKG